MCVEGGGFMRLFQVHLTEPGPQLLYQREIWLRSILPRLPYIPTGYILATGGHKGPPLLFPLATKGTDGRTTPKVVSDRPH